jgi:hypothetical protein
MENIISRFHRLSRKEVETAGRDLQDAEAAGDNEVGEFLKEARGQYRQIADKAKALLGQRQ